MPELDRLLQAFHLRHVGTRQRGQVVEQCELQIETNNQGPPRYFLTVWFQGRQMSPDAKPEQILVQRIMVDSRHAYATATLSRGELLAVLEGELELPPERWLLQDEQMTQEK